MRHWSSGYKISVVSKGTEFEAWWWLAVGSALGMSRVFSTSLREFIHVHSKQNQLRFLHVSATTNLRKSLSYNHKTGIRICGIFAGIHNTKSYHLLYQCNVIAFQEDASCESWIIKESMSTRNEQEGGEDGTNLILSLVSHHECIPPQRHLLQCS